MSEQSLYFAKDVTAEVDEIVARFDIDPDSMIELRMSRHLWESIGSPPQLGVTTQWPPAPILSTE